MMTKYNCDFDKESVSKRILYLINQVYKLLPSREEGGEWMKPLSTILEELSGFYYLFQEPSKEIFLPLMAKLEGLFTLTEEESFSTFRRTIFECLNLMGDLRNDWNG